MKIEHELDDSRLCEGCPCISDDSEWGVSCNLHYWPEGNWETPTTIWWNPKTKEILNDFPKDKVPNTEYTLSYIRPDKCRQERGE